MIGEYPIKQILLDSQECWDNPGTPTNVRENFRKVINCGTIALGAEVYASNAEWKLVYHTCKSRFCTSCGQRATEEWQENLNAALPDVPYVGITLTLPRELWPILQENRHLLHDIPAMGAEAIQLCATSRHDASVFVVVVTQTAGGFLKNFVPHLHVMVSAGGLQKSTNRWIFNVSYQKGDIMRAWRYAVMALLAEAVKRNVLKSGLTREELMTMFESQYRRAWHIFIGRPKPKACHLKHDGRYIRRPPVAQHRLRRVGDHEVEYLAKDTRNKKFVARRYSTEEFVEILKEHMPDRGKHAMRYFGLLAPRSKRRIWAGMFLLLGQKKRPRPGRLRWRWLRLSTFGIDPLLDSFGQRMHWVGRQRPAIA